MILLGFHNFWKADLNNDLSTRNIVLKYSSLVTTNANCVTSGVVIWFCRKTAWRKLWSCRSLKFSFWTHFCFGTKQRNRLDYLWIANAKIYNDSVSDIIVLGVWNINEVGLLHTLLFWTILIAVVFLVFDGQRIQGQNKSNV